MLQRENDFMKQFSREAEQIMGYVEGWLKESDLLLIDLSCGEILFQDKAGKMNFTSHQMEHDAISIFLEKKKARSCLD